jgi:SlyX protein
MSLPDNDSITEIERRLVDVEIRVTHQEALLETLNDVVVSQQQQIDRLDEALKQARKRLQELDTGPGVTTEAEEPPPPHY